MRTSTTSYSADSIVKASEKGTENVVNLFVRVCVRERVCVYVRES